MTKSFIFICVFCALSACAPYMYDYKTPMDAGLSTLKGRDITYVISVLGLPDDQMEVAGRKVYTWRNQGQKSYNVATTIDNSADTTIESLEAPSGLTNVQYARNTTPEVFTHKEYKNYSCFIKLMVNNQDVVEYWEYDGDYDGCSKYIGKFEGQ